MLFISPAGDAFPKQEVWDLNSGCVCVCMGIRSARKEKYDGDSFGHVAECQLVVLGKKYEVISTIIFWCFENNFIGKNRAFFKPSQHYLLFKLLLFNIKNNTFLVLNKI